MGFKLVDGPVDIREYPADQTHGSFQAGDLVDLSDGEVILSAATTKVFGVALKDYGASATIIPVCIIHGDQTWLTEAATTTTTAMCGIGYGLTKTAGGACLDNTDTGDVEAVILKLDPRDGATTGAGGRVHIRFQDRLNQTQIDA